MRVNPPFMHTVGKKASLLDFFVCQHEQIQKLMKIDETLFAQHFLLHRLLIKSLFSHFQALNLAVCLHKRFSFSILSC